MKELLTLGVIALVIWLAWSALNPTKWYGTYETATSVGSQEVGSKEACQEWLNDQRMNAGGERFNFECGSNCKLDAVANMYYCKETFD